MSHQFKMSNKHVFCQLIITHIHFSFVRSHKITKVKDFEIIEVEEFFCIKVSDIQKLKFKIKKLTQTLTKPIIMMF